MLSKWLFGTLVANFFNHNSLEKTGLIEGVKHFLLTNKSKCKTLHFSCVVNKRL